MTSMAAAAGRPARSVIWYLTERFPLFTQGGAVLSAYVCAYLLYGRIAGGLQFGSAAVVGGATFVLLFLVRRIVDDVEDLRDDLAARGLSLDGDGRRQLNGLLAGALTVAAAVAALNAWWTDLLLASVGVLAWFPVATVLKRTLTANRLVRFGINETCPLAILVYAYIAWSQVGGRLSTAAVVSTVVLFWSSYCVWNFTRKLGTVGWTPWDMTLPRLRWALFGFVLLCAGASGAVQIHADLTAAYLAYTTLLVTGFVAWMSLDWPKIVSAAHAARDIAPPWRGLLFPAGVQLGVLFALLVVA
jgi:hypothetical protein